MGAQSVIIAVRERLGRFSEHRDGDFSSDSRQGFENGDVAMLAAFLRIYVGDPGAREIAEVLRDGDLPSIGASARPTRDGVRADILQGREFLRISIKREGERYLLHLPVIRE